MTKIEITAETVDELVDQFADVWMYGRDIEARFVGCSVKSIGYWRDLGLLRKRETPKRQRQPWVEFNVADVIVARSNTRVDRTFLRRMRKDGGFDYRCNSCLKWKDEGSFFNDGRPSGYGKFTKCKKCRHEMTIENRKREEVKQKERERFGRVYRERKAMKDAASKWQPPKRIDTSIVLAFVDARYAGLPDPPTDAELSRRAGVNEDFVRAMRRNKQVFCENADALLVGLGMHEEAAQLNAIIEEGRPMWHRDHPYCARCLRNNVTYCAAGLCMSCYKNRANPDYIPATGTWSKYHNCCTQCKRSNVKHAAKGLCHACYYRPRRQGVGSGHGNPRSIPSQP